MIRESVAHGRHAHGKPRASGDDPNYVEHGEEFI